MNVEEYTRDINELYASWKNKICKEHGIDHKNNIYIKDGVVCPEVWFKQKIRPLYLLKEAYNWSEDGSLIDDYLMDPSEKMHRIWKNVCEWTEGILATTKDSLPIYEETKYKNYANDSLKKIAVVNVKKSSGKNTSNMDEINRYAACDSAELKREIELCDPTIIICGYTISSLNKIMDKEIKDPKHPDRDWIYETEINNHKVMVIDYYHPANQYPTMMNFYTLMRIYQLGLQRQ